MSALGKTLNPALQRLGAVSVRLSVELGRTNMALRDVLTLAEGSVVSLDRLTDELLDITANGQVIAHGEVIAQDGRFALRIVNLAGGEDSLPAGPSGGPKPDIPNQAEIGPSEHAPQGQKPEEPAPIAPEKDASE
nr:FliM/FliN family flagellar motor switch protein [uncultured Erythrobacter sp.]